MLGAADRDPHPLQEAVVPVDVDRDDLVVEQVEQRDVRGLAGELRRRPLAVELPRLGVIGGVGEVHRTGRGWRRVQRDRVQAELPCLGQRRVHRIPVRRDDDPRVPGGDRIVDRADLGGRVAVSRARRNIEIDATGRGVGLRALLHPHEVGIRERLQDQRDLHALSTRATRAARAAGTAGGNCQRRDGGERGHGQPPATPCTCSPGPARRTVIGYHETLSSFWMGFPAEGAGRHVRQRCPNHTGDPSSCQGLAIEA